MFKQLTHPLVRTAVAAVLGLLTLGQAVLAGNVDLVNKYAWSTNAGWVNLQPTNGGVVVHADHLEGYAWGENVGWIRMGADHAVHADCGAHTYANDGPTTYGVNMDGAGKLSGYAWGTNVGWINFDPDHGGVTIDPATGAFSGDAWGENIGWVRFRGVAQNGTDYGVNAEPCTAILTVTKALDPTTDDGRFVMKADGVAGDQLGHGAQVTVTVGVGATAYFTETAGADTALSNYATEYRCDDPSATSGVTANSSLTMPSVDVTCIFTNTRRVDTVESTTGVGPVTYSVDNCAIDTFDAVAERSLPNAGKPSVDFVYGFFGLKLVGCPIGGTANVTIELPTNLPVGSEFWKYQGSWFEYPFGSDDGDNVITIALTDVGAGDADGVANGEIIDPAGPGTPVAPAVILTESYGVSTVTEGQLTGEGSIACYWVTLNVQPGADVIVDVASQKGQLDVWPQAVTLNASNWDNLTLTDRSNFVCMRATDNKSDDSGKDVCKQKQDDLLGQSRVVDGDECGDVVDYIEHTVSSANPDFDKLTDFVSNGLQDLDNNPSTVDGLIRDNDATGVVFTESYAATDLDEGGAPVGVACYWVNLTTAPSAPVTVTVLSDDVHLGSGADHDHPDPGE